ncbi:MAG: zinc-dependent peptidase [Chitinophagaceae bacterium]|nr:zinc-dependent peptidase [Chitinophagaceae bacterium]
METLLIIVIVLAIFVLLGVYIFSLQKKKLPELPPFPETYRSLLLAQCDFYYDLPAEAKQSFEKRMQLFLTQVKITGVKTAVNDIDKVLIAASAIIPIFGFPEWEYVNLREVLLYPDSFSHDFEQNGNNRNVLGMVGEGALNGVMILSQHELRQAFTNKTGKSNTAIHEFVHLVDKTDGSIDGIPEFFLQRQYILPWLQLMRREMDKIMADRSDIDPYGAPSEAEFLAVVSEYFFERPDLLEDKNPELYKLLSTIFRQQPAG